jgi:hypothetical protein
LQVIIDFPKYSLLLTQNRHALLTGNHKSDV